MKHVLTVINTTIITFNFFYTIFKTVDEFESNFHHEFLEIPSGCHNDTFSKGASACLARMLGFIRLHSDRVRPVMPKLDIGMMGHGYHRVS